MRTVTCENVKTASTEACGAELFQTDGEFVYIGGSIINPDAQTQTIGCGRCAHKAIWVRDAEKQSE